MRLGIVRGTVVLNLSVPQLTGTRLLIVEPVTAAGLSACAAKPRQAGETIAAGAKTLIVADQIGPSEGQLIAFVESREAANPFPGGAPVDAYCSLIVDTVNYQPPGSQADASTSGAAGSVVNGRVKV